MDPWSESKGGPHSHLVPAMSLDWEWITRKWDKRPPQNRSTLQVSYIQREQWWHIRCWLKPRLFAAGVTQKQWSYYKRKLQQQLKTEGFEAAAQHAERILAATKSSATARHR